MKIKTSKLKTVVNELPDERLVKQFDLNLSKLLTTARKINVLGDIIKDILIDIDKSKSKQQSLSHTDWQKFMFEDRVEEPFLSEKSNYETISFWYWIVNEKEEAMEYYYQLCNQETNFTQLKEQYTNVRYLSDQLVSQLDAGIAKALRYTALNVPTLPVRTKQGYLILQKCSFKKAKLDKNLKQKLLDKLEEEWFVRQLSTFMEET